MIRIIGSLSIFFWMILGINDALAQDTLTVMSYNIYHGEQAYEAGSSNIQEVADLINKVEPDFVALQEIDNLTGRSASLNKGTPFSLVDSLAELTNMHGYFGKAIDFDGGEYGEGLLSREQLKPQKKMLPIPEGGETRAVLFVKAQTKSEYPFIFGGTHLGHQSAANRVAQVKAINNYFSNENVPVILAGDFNFTPDSGPSLIMNRDWIDAATQMQEDPPDTHSFKEPNKRIDYLFLSPNSNWKVVKFDTIKVDYSDHLPLVATIVLHLDNESSR